MSTQNTHRKNISGVSSRPVVLIPDTAPYVLSMLQPDYDQDCKQLTQTQYKQKFCRIKLFEIELFDHLTVYKQVTDIYLNF